VTWIELRRVLNEGPYSHRFRTKRDFVEFARTVDPKTRVGFTKGPGRLTVKRALRSIGVVLEEAE